ncbi:hypothetical protein GQ42DRAFT_42911 [Ramicandelaber brevisporus]|nr:hypothetical protein GQ42DRAFT_42911 [Ramicandelaber brevisporus]
MRFIFRAVSPTATAVAVAAALVVLVLLLDAVQSAVISKPRKQADDTVAIPVTPSIPSATAVTTAATAAIFAKRSLTNLGIAASLVRIKALENQCLGAILSNDTVIAPGECLRYGSSNSRTQVATKDIELFTFEASGGVKSNPQKTEYIPSSIQRLSATVKSTSFPEDFDGSKDDGDFAIIKLSESTFDSKVHPPVRLGLTLLGQGAVIDGLSLQVTTRGDVVPQLAVFDTTQNVTSSMCVDRNGFEYDGNGFQVGNVLCSQFTQQDENACQNLPSLLVYRPEGSSNNSNKNNNNNISTPLLMGISSTANSTSEPCPVHLEFTNLGAFTPDIAAMAGLDELDISGGKGTSIGGDDDFESKYGSEEMFPDEDEHGHNTALKIVLGIGIPVLVILACVLALLKSCRFCGRTVAWRNRRIVYIPKGGSQTIAVADVLGKSLPPADIELQKQSLSNSPYSSAVLHKAS